MDFSASATLRAAPDDVLVVVADLGTYPDWLGIVAAAVAAEPHSQDPGPAWQVTLQARLGPLVRRKRLRMVRTGSVPEVAPDGRASLRFERMEHDGAHHGAWLLTADLSPLCEGLPRQQDGGSSQNGTVLTIGLHYGGAGWVPGLDRILGEQARRAGRRLDALLSG